MLERRYFYSVRKRQLNSNQNKLQYQPINIKETEIWWISNSNILITSVSCNPCLRHLPPADFYKICLWASSEFCRYYTEKTSPVTLTVFLINPLGNFPQTYIHTYTHTHTHTHTHTDFLVLLFVIVSPYLYLLIFIMDNYHDMVYSSPGIR